MASGSLPLKAYSVVSRVGVLVSCIRLAFFVRAIGSTNTPVQKHRPNEWITPNAQSRRLRMYHDAMTALAINISYAAVGIDTGILPTLIPYETISSIISLNWLANLLFSNASLHPQLNSAFSKAARNKVRNLV